MREQAPATAFERWANGLRGASKNSRWAFYDCEIKAAVSEFNRHLNSSPGFRPLDWKLIKAMIWTETGADNKEWKTKPMQIGVQGDPGLSALLNGNEGGDLVLPPAWQKRLSVLTVRTTPSHNIRAGIAYLLMRMANFDYRSVPEGSAVLIVTVNAGDNFEKIAKHHSTTPELLKKLNPTATVLRPGLALKYQKATSKRVITGWRTISSAMVAQRYNGGGDPNYAKKLDFALSLVVDGKEATCD